ncbi:MAG TPA: peptide chain release factor N(5)-glutamine methyltransferase [Anaerolineae bacterium]|nr:peptide chain release factor N(5)-glutamine methyltransferase [Anaerolineae bacterium]
MMPELAEKRSRPAKKQDWIATNESTDRRGQAPIAQPLQTFQWRLADDIVVGLALVAATQRLASNGVDSPKLDSEVLLGFVLGCTRAQLYAHPERLLTEDERHLLERLVVRRCQHEPVAYLVGEKAFYGLDFFVDQRVLIPRPETELLVDMVLDVALQYDPLRSNGRNSSQPAAGRFLVADIGAGSGAVSVAIAANTDTALIYAVDISQDALEVAQVNARRHGLESRIQFLQGDLLAPLPEMVDVIAANLPYVATHEWSDLAPGIVNYEPAQALLGGVDGLDFISRLLEQAPTCLKPGGVILLEVGANQGSAVGEMARRCFPQALIEVLTDYAFRERIVRIQT